MPEETQQPALTLEQARDKMIEAVSEVISHPDASPVVARWVEGFANATMRKLDEMAAQDASSNLNQRKEPSTEA